VCVFVYCVLCVDVNVRGFCTMYIYAHMCANTNVYCVSTTDADRMIEDVIKVQRELKSKIQRQQEELEKLRAQLTANQTE
jgi:hypothetical protein